MSDQSFRGLSVKVRQWMAGAKHAIVYGGCLYVSPAMHALFKDTTPGELESLLTNIGAVTVPYREGWDVAGFVGRPGEDGYGVAMVDIGMFTGLPTLGMTTKGGPT
ncbi:hypothetical protein [Gemmata sp.]|uniref:hypothetical protein n=1 Tax=Gemmata sp. TaxID=1914242 RepID=UPI003F719734